MFIVESGSETLFAMVSLFVRNFDCGSLNIPENPSFFFGGWRKRLSSLKPWYLICADAKDLTAAFIPWIYTVLNHLYCGDENVFQNFSFKEIVKDKDKVMFLDKSV